jgi:hypothetical protein
VPERVFGTEPERMAEFYGIGDALARGTAALLADPGCLQHIIGRTDLLPSARGFLCCELNAAGSIGGWMPWEELLVRQRLIAEFIAECVTARGMRVRPIDSIATLLEYAIEVGLARGLPDVTGGTELNLAILTLEAIPPGFGERLGRLYRQALARLAPGLDGKLFIGTERDLTADARGGAWHGSRPVQLFIDQIMERLDGPVFRSQAAGLGFAFNGMVSPVLSDKRNLALLSEQAEAGDLYDAGERAAIARCIPWTRVLADGFTDRDGERFYLPDYARAERASLVIKPANQYGGRDVFVGSALPRAEWEARLDDALAAGDWVVQEMIPMDEYLFQGPEGGAIPHGLVWATFHFGARYVSCLVRGAPSGARVINLKTGGRRIVALEVEDGAAVSSIEPSLPEETHDAP